MSRQMRLFLIFILLTCVIAIILIYYMPSSADVIYFNGKIYTMDEKKSIVEAIAVSGERIVGVGTSEKIKRKYSAPDLIDLNGKTVIPGLIDAHCHLLGLGLAHLTIDLTNSGSEFEAAKKVAEKTGALQLSNWIRGRGWDQNLWKVKLFPTHKSLDKYLSHTPIYLTRVDGHACWVNKKAMEIAGVDKNTRDPVGGKIIRDANGNPTGVFIDAAMELIYRFVPEPTEDEINKAITSAIKECLSYGLTSVHEMGIDSKQYEVYKQMIDDNNFPIRLYGAIDGTSNLWDTMKDKGPLIGYGNNKLTIRALKLFIDGALGSRGAALIEPYSDDPYNRGVTVLSDSNLNQFVDEALNIGFQVCVHAIGDRANHIILNTYEKYLDKLKLKNARLRIEHAQVLAPYDIPRFRKLNVIPSMQPTHCTSDMYWAEARLGSKRIRGAYAWRSLLETGIAIAGGSDFPVESPNPFFGIYAACTRRDLNGIPKNAKEVQKLFEISPDGIIDEKEFENGWYVSQKMTREEAVRSFTTWAAYSAFEEDIKGSIEKGKLADFIIISNDIFTCDENEIPKTTVEKTFIGGKLVFVR